MQHGVDIHGGADGDDGPEEVRPDIDGFVVQVEQRLEGVRVRGADLAVPGADKGVVTAPGGQVVPEEEEFGLCFLLEGLYGGEYGFGGGRAAAAQAIWRW